MWEKIQVPTNIWTSYLVSKQLLYQANIKQQAKFLMELRLLFLV